MFISKVFIFIYTRFAIFQNTKKMTKKEKIHRFISENDPQIIKDYHDKLFDNLKELNEKEEKHIFWLCVVIFLYLISGNIAIQSISLGPVTINDSSAITKILPLIFVYIVYVLHSITGQKKDINLAFEIITANQFNRIGEKENTVSFLSRIYRPFEYSNSFSHFLKDKPDIIESLIGFIILLPLLAIGFAPYFVSISMIIDLYKNYMGDTLGKISFWITLWLFIITIFQIIVNTIKNYKEENSK